MTMFFVIASDFRGGGRSVPARRSGVSARRRGNLVVPYTS